MTTPLHLKYFICINDQFPPSVSKWCEHLPRKGNIYSVRRRYSDDNPTTKGEEEAYLLWEIRNNSEEGKNKTYFGARYFKEIERANMAPIYDLDQISIGEICTRFIHRVDKLRRMATGVASELVEYHDGVMELEASTHNEYYLGGEKLHPVFRNIPPSWLIPPELKAASCFKMKIFLSKRKDTGEWEQQLVNEVEGTFGREPCTM